MRKLNHRKELITLLISGVLSAIGLVIALYMPARIAVGPATYTLASHVVIFIAMFISPKSAFLVSGAVSIGFFAYLGPVVGFRALSHMIWAVPGALFLKRFPSYHTNIPKSILFNIIIAIIHGIIEALVVMVIFFGGWWDINTRDTNIWVFLVVFLAVGGAVHSIIDFMIAQLITHRLDFEIIFNNHEQ